ncbi:MAG: hypothetical protein IH958_00335 [Chloroflexi bacterium]|nr:hypothetical protein [Chloroflexota bacterium]
MLAKLAFLSVLGLLVIACGGGGSSGPPADHPVPTIAITSVLAGPVDAATAAIEALAAVSGRMPDEIEVLSVTRMQWPDACLGLPEADEACAEVITPGYEVTLSLDDDVSVYRTDESSNVRLAGADEAAP